MSRRLSVKPYVDSRLLFSFIIHLLFLLLTQTTYYTATHTNCPPTVHTTHAYVSWTSFVNKRPLLRLLAPSHAPPSNQM